MLSISDAQFQKMIDEALGTLPKEHVEGIKNVAILFEDEPSPQQRIELKLACNQTLLGLYQGVPLAQRQGTQPILPDRITLFKKPMLMRNDTIAGLKEEIRHTLWHEIAHYYGLNHAKIHELEQ
jgi:predicted Zn-dependent protease with MMP-like domain